VGFADLRDTLQTLDDRGRLLRVEEPVSAAFEAAAVLAASARRGDGAVLLPRVDGHTVPVCGNVVYGREVLAWSLGVAPEAVPAELTRRLGNPTPPVATDGAPVQAVEARTSVAETLPILTHYRDDSGPFITTGMISARDPDSGRVARGIHRMELRGENQLGMALLNPPLADVYARHRQQGTRMPVAAVVGIDPLTFCALALKGSPQVDKLALAGGLRGAPVEVTNAARTGIPVPARAEFLLEGELDPTAECEDGPLGEIGGYSLSFPATPTFRVGRIAHRPDPIYHALLPTGPEGDLLLTTVAEASIASRVQEQFPFLRRTHFVPSTFGSSLVVQVAPAAGGQVRSLLVQLLTLGMVKKVVAVADDVDPSDPLDVEWSVATRCQPDKDTMILPGLKGQPLDPSCPELFRTAKLAVDATGYERVRGHRRAVLDPEALARAATLLQERSSRV
jgi:2,5-furandicarboxylate decarboxylase 1